ncbi:hypothetical protein COLO4_30341 [Corchorus olitorius]|uniref:Uncharacterized protein n=1 Tax=Corchorus olitorius TaxID=93759 RepID=A0A1R3H902_9ROSI|nr:hypothetical protein COLO4_30341 [Corchorus olitorius]
MDLHQRLLQQYAPPSGYIPAGLEETRALTPPSSWEYFTQINIQPPPNLPQTRVAASDSGPRARVPTHQQLQLTPSHPQNLMSHQELVTEAKFVKEYISTMSNPSIQCNKDKKYRLNCKAKSEYKVYLIQRLQLENEMLKEKIKGYCVNLANKDLLIERQQEEINTLTDENNRLESENEMLRQQVIRSDGHWFEIDEMP